MIKKVLAIIWIISAISFVSESDYQDQVKQEQHYCEMVSFGKWPAYKSINCEGK